MTTTYTVQPGDTFESLLQKFGVDRKSLAQLNNIIDPATIENNPGMVIQIPDAPSPPSPPAPPAPTPAPTNPGPTSPSPTTTTTTPPSPGGSGTRITVKTAMEIIAHEAIVQEAYKDSRGVWTWSIGLTNSSRHRVFPKYVDNPQTLTRCLEVFEWALRVNYAAAVDEVFAGFDLTEEQFAGALSFHYNTGGIRSATWAKRWKEGKHDEARETFMNWRKPAEIIPRRAKERDLFFDGIWTGDGQAMCYPVCKPSYQPDFANAHRVDIHDILVDVLARAGT